MKCLKCGLENQDNAKFCNDCGEYLINQKQFDSDYNKNNSSESNIFEEPKSSKGMGALFFGSVFTILGAVIYYISQQLFTYTRYQNFGYGIVIPYEVQEQTYSNLAVPGIIAIIVGIVILVVGIIQYSKNSK